MSKKDKNIETQVSEGWDFSSKYYNGCMRTAASVGSTKNYDALHAVLGIATELDEMETDDHLIEEIGDPLWFSCLLCRAYGFDFQAIALKTLLFTSNEVKKSSFSNAFKIGLGEEEYSTLIALPNSGQVLSMGVHTNMRRAASYMLDVIKAETFYDRKEFVSFSDKLMKRPKSECQKISIKEAMEESLIFFLTSLSQFAYFNNIDITEACELNLEKLRKRYPDKFSSDNANNRSENEEKKTFQNKK